MTVTEARLRVYLKRALRRRGELPPYDAPTPYLLRRYLIH